LTLGQFGQNRITMNLFRIQAPFEHGFQINPGRFLRAKAQHNAQPMRPGRVDIQEPARRGRIALRWQVCQQDLGKPRPSRQPGIKLSGLENIAQHVPRIHREDPAAG